MTNKNNVAILQKLKKRVDKGIALLNKKKKGWYKDIDLATLDMSKASRCVLGQLYGHYFYGIEGINCLVPHTTAWRYGLILQTTKSEIVDLSWEYLTLLWVFKISELKLKDLAKKPRSS